MSTSAAILDTSQGRTGSARRAGDRWIRSILNVMVPWCLLLTGEDLDDLEVWAIRTWDKKGRRGFVFSSLG